MNQNLISWSGSYRNVKPANEIFIVDDDADMRDILAATLEPMGLPVRVFEDGDSFLRAARTEVPICVFLDILMPRRSGLEILQELRTLNYWTPIFLISALDDVTTVVDAMKSGAHGGYISKPFDRHTPLLRVRDAVEVWSCRERERKALNQQANEDGEWVLLTPNEKDILLLARLMQN